MKQLPQTGIFSTGRQARVLIVDDEPGVLRAAERVLESHHAVAAASSPAEAIMLTPTFRPDLVICDIRMPGMDGFEVVERIRAARPGVDVIFMTGSHTDPDAQLVRSIKDRAFYFIQKPFDRQVLMTLVERCLELRRLREAESMHLRRIEQELAEAKIVQNAMLGPTTAEFDGITLHARSKACSELCGDFYDFAHVGPDRVAVIVADACGHGVSAALLTASVKSAFQTNISDGFDPLAVIDRLAGTMAAFTPDRFVTAFVALIDRAARQLSYVNAGHPAAFLWGRHTEPHTERNPTPEPLNSSGPWVGSAFPLKSWEIERINLPHSARLLVYTDGVPDLRGPEGRFGISRVVDHVTDRSAENATLLDRLTADLSFFTAGRPLTDDYTMVQAVVR